MDGAIVIATNVGISERIIDDSEYYKDNAIAPCGKYIRLELLKSYPHNSLTLKEMKENGVIATFQSPTKAVGILAGLLKELDKNI